MKSIKYFSDISYCIHSKGKGLSHYSRWYLTVKISNFTVPLIFPENLDISF